MGIMNELGEDGGARGRRRRRRPKRRVRRTATRRVNPAQPLLTQTYGAVAASNANFAAVENGRPNCAYNAISPATVVNNATASGEFTFNDDTYVCYGIVVEGDAEAFVLESLSVAGFEIVKSGPANLAAFLNDMNRVDRPTPLTGRMFTAGVKVTARVKNISGADATFNGFTLWCQETACIKTNDKTRVAPNVLSYSAMRRIVGGLGQKRLLPRHPTNLLR